VREWNDIARRLAARRYICGIKLSNLGHVKLLKLLKKLDFIENIIFDRAANIHLLVFMVARLALDVSFSTQVVNKATTSATSAVKLLVLAPARLANLSRSSGSSMISTVLLMTLSGHLVSPAIIRAIGQAM
jgi:hypothetical protein